MPKAELKLKLLIDRWQMEELRLVVWLLSG